VNDIIETEEEAAARIRGWRARKALEQAPELMEFVRSIAVGGQSERGETLPEWTAPMRITAAEESDSVYAQLIDWVSFWAEVLDSPPPAVHLSAWRAREEVQGFRPGTTSNGAHILTRLLTMWLLQRSERIAEHPTAQAYQDDVCGLIWSLRAKYPTAPRPEKLVNPRPCPKCGELGVQAGWGSENELDVTVECMICGSVVEADPLQLVKWLAVNDEALTLSVECEEGRHDDCESLSCTCPHHLPAAAIVGDGAPSGAVYEPRDRNNNRKAVSHKPEEGKN
jgi:hypothetical protein